MNDKLANLDIKKIAIYAGGGACIIIAIVLLIKWLKSKLSDTITETQQAYITSLEIATESVSFTQAQLNTLVAKLKTAFGKWGWGTDEDAVYEVFEACNSRSDVLSLIKEFGVEDGHTLAEWINKELNAEEIEHIQSILEAKGIVYQF